jgi:hypothetical protein
MLKKLGLPVLALGTMLALFTPRPAQAKVHVGVYFGTPAYTYPVPADPYGYVNPYTYSYPYGYGYAYGPTYVTPYWGGHFRHEHRDRDDRGFFNHGQNFRGGDHDGGHDRGHDRGEHHDRH